MSVSVDFQNRFNDMISDLDSKRSELPAIIGIDYRSLSNALNYGIIPTPKILIRIADYLDISINYLLARTEEDYFEKLENSAGFHKRFQDLAKEKDVTYYKISKACHFDNSYISRWIIKNQLPSLELLDLLTDYFDVSIDYLLGRTDQRQ